MKGWLLAVRERRLFYLILGLVLVVLVLVRWIVASRPPIEGILDNLLSAALISFVALAFYRIVPREYPQLKFVSQIDPSLSNDLHGVALATSTWWWSFGHYARWVRTEAAPKLAAKGGSELRLIVLDPQNPDLLEQYVDFRRHHRMAFQEAWSVKSLLIELYATLFAAYYYHNDTSPLRVQIYVSSVFSPIRMDISAAYAIVTTIDPRDPPLAFGSDSAWHAVVRSHFEQSFLCSKNISLDSDIAIDEKAITEAKVAEVLSGMGFPLPDQHADIAETIASQWKRQNRKYY